MEKEVKYVPPPANEDAADGKFVPETHFVGVGKTKRRPTSVLASALPPAHGRFSLCVSVATLAAVLVLFAVFFVYVREEVEVKHDKIFDEISRLEDSVQENHDQIQEMQQISIGEMKSNPCLQPMESGPCEAAMPRWYYNPSLGQCSQFSYGGCEGNDNNFVTLTSCVRSCETKDKKIISLQERDPKKLLDASKITEIPDEPNVDPVESAEPTDDENPCEIEPSAGPCRALLPRYYFDRQEGTCKKFLYGGCSGNTNNFMTEVECMERCGKPFGREEVAKTNNRRALCSLPAEVGLCRALIERWSFDSAAGECKLFYWGGCGGNENNFASKEKCEMECSELNDGEDADLTRDFNVAEDRCGLPMDPGPCRAAMPRYYYSLTTEKCEPFAFGGCDGNENNFQTLEACQKSCTEEEGV